LQYFGARNLRAPFFFRVKVLEADVYCECLKSYKDNAEDGRKTEKRLAKFFGAGRRAKVEIGLYACLTQNNFLSAVGFNCPRRFLCRLTAAAPPGII
jgi:hypothetical protein